jgi:hypothetical protein
MQACYEIPLRDILPKSRLFSFQGGCVFIEGESKLYRYHRMTKQKIFSFFRKISAHLCAHDCSDDVSSTPWKLRQFSGFSNQKKM